MPEEFNEIKKKKRLADFFRIIWKHKIITGIFIIALIAGAYFGYQKTNVKENSAAYVTTTVEKGMLISSISGAGQVSASNRVEVKPKVSGDLVLVSVKAGQTVKQGDLIAQIDTRSAARSVSDAKSTLENAKLELEELLAPVDKMTLIQAENALADAKDSLIKLKTTHVNNYQNTVETKQKAEDNLEKAYEDAYNDMTDAFLDLPDIMVGLYTILFSDEISDSEPSVNQHSNDSALVNAIPDSDDQIDFNKYLNKAKDEYQTAKSDYNENFDDYKNTSRYSSKTAMAELLEQTLETTKKISDAIKSEANMLDWWVEYQTDKEHRIYSKVTDYQSELGGYTSDTNGHLSSLLAVQRSIEDYKEAILDADRDLEEIEQNQPLELAAAERSLAEKEQKLIDLKAGATELEIKNKELAVRQKENSLLEAQNNYADHFIRVPFDGQVAEVSAIKGDSASSGTAICTLITNQKIAEITLNEIDAAQVKTGQKATLTFDAVPDLSITGEVVEVDTLGTVNQGVVSYNIKIAFDVQDERIKPDMSVSVNIIIESKLNVLLAPLSSVKTTGVNSYVEILLNGRPQRKTVTAGLSNDTMVEIVDGLAEGEEIIAQTINNSADQNNSSDQNRQPGFGGEFRMLR